MRDLIMRRALIIFLFGIFTTSLAQNAESGSFTKPIANEGTIQQPCADRRSCQRACEANDLGSCHRLGLMLKNGRGGGARDVAAAARYFALACNNGNGNGHACRELGLLHRSGQLGNVDLVTARDFLEMSCARSNPEGCFHLGVMNVRGESGPIDYVSARAQFLISCERGHPFSCYELAKLLEVGSGGPTDLQLSRSYYARACLSTRIEGCRERDRLDRQLANQ